MSERGEVCYVGRVISAEGYKMNPKDLEAVKALKHKMPTTVQEVRKLMGFLSYYRPYIPDFSRTAKPLYKLLAKPKQKNKQKKRGLAVNLLSYHYPTQSSGQKSTKKYKTK